MASFQGNFQNPHMREQDPSQSSLLRGSYISEASSPYGNTSHNSISDKFSLAADPASWGSNISPNTQDPDDYLHNPDPRKDKLGDSGSVFTVRGIANVGCLALLGVGLIALFVGYPVASYFTTKAQSNLGGFNLGGVNASGQVPEMKGNYWGLIDPDTPEDVLRKPSYMGGEDLVLVFSDEFNVDGRTFYPGDDPYWEAVDMNYWGTNNLEWYDPAGIITKGGNLEITLKEKQTHGLDYEGGLMSTWNKFCFTGGLIETSLVLPGSSSVQGLWPAVWTMGNLGRAGYGASLDGTWPYSYDSCDVGTVSNQTVDGQPVAATVNGDASFDGVLSFLPGQRLSRCTCDGESHPGPKHRDGTYVGRSAPEIDIIEAQVDATTGGHVSQSGQWAPFNAEYKWFNETGTYEIYDHDVTHLNSYLGGVYQQASSCVAQTNQDCYEHNTGCYSIYGFEYKPGYNEGYITWINDGVPSWTIYGSGMREDPRVELGARPITGEPLYAIANLGVSNNFGFVDFENLIFPAVMRIDWIRIYQKESEVNIGCDPPDYPTQAYINEYYEAYTNPNLTTWVDDYKQVIPKNSFLGEC